MRYIYLKGSFCIACHSPDRIELFTEIAIRPMPIDYPISLRNQAVAVPNFNRQLRAYSFVLPSNIFRISTDNSAGSKSSMFVSTTTPAL